MSQSSSAALNVPRIGIIADSDLNLHLLQSTLHTAGYKIVTATDVDRLDKDYLAKHQVDVWIVELEKELDNDAVFDLLYDIETVPILMGDGVPPQTEPEAHRRWQVRLKEKLARVECAGLVGSVDDEVNPIIQQAHRVASGDDAPTHVWVLAASMGGPEAVKVFLDALPVNMPVAFVYAQHIDDDCDDLLVQVMGRNNSLRMSTCMQGHALRHGQVTIVPTDHMIRLMPLGKIHNLPDIWDGPFSPCIDRVIVEVATLYKQYSGTIVFSGMSNDGAAGANAMKELGGTVWAQSPASCICSSMPDSALATGSVSFTGTPEELAQALMEKYASEYVLAKGEH